MPVKAETKYYSDGNMPPTLTPFHVVTSKDGEILAQCDSKEYADYIQETMNFHYYSRRMMDVYDKIKDDVVGTIILDGEVVPKSEKVIPYMDTSSVVRYRPSGDYTQFINKFCKSNSKLFQFKEDGPLRNLNLYLVILFYVSSDYNKNIGDCIAAVMDGLEKSHIISKRNKVQVYGVAKSAFIRTKTGQRTEIYLMNWGGKL